MSLFSSLGIALSGIQASTMQLEIASGNISNANVDGYTKKTAVLTASTLGSSGSGVKVSGFTRANNATLFITLSKATSAASKLEAQDEYFEQVLDILGISSSYNPTLSATMTDFVNAWTQLSAEPESSVSQQQVIQSADNLADEIQRLASEVESLDRQCANDIRSSVESLNNYLNQIQDLNSKISQLTTSGLSAGNLEDERDRVLLNISGMLSITVLPRDNGQIAVYTKSGYQLVDGSSVCDFSYNATDVVEAGNLSLSLNDTLVGGTIEGFVAFRKETSPVSTDSGTSVIQKLRDQLDAVVDALVSTTTTATSGEVTFATAYNNATTGAGELAASFFTGADRTTIVVNSALIAGTSSVKMASPNAVTDALLDATRVFSADGLTTAGSDYSSLITSIMAGFQQDANNIDTLSETATAQQKFLKEKISNETSVNTDEEMVHLIILQQAYTASSRVITVISELFNALLATV